jgi:hypothetical protein
MKGRKKQNHVKESISFFVVEELLIQKIPGKEIKDLKKEGKSG